MAQAVYNTSKKTGQYVQICIDNNIFPAQFPGVPRLCLWPVTLYMQIFPWDMNLAIWYVAVSEISGFYQQTHQTWGCIYIYICMYVCMYVYIYIMYICIYIHTYVYIYIYIWTFLKMGVPQYGWFIMENTIEMDVWGYPYFRKPPLYIYIYSKYGIKRESKHGIKGDSSCGM